jgi:Arc/MetJ-type ribon-helix-helix transcriptional regulator
VLQDTAANTPKIAGKVYDFVIPSPRSRRGIWMDENERITLRLEKENLELIDAFLEANTSFGNRSKLVREAVQAYIQTIREGGNAVTIRIPRYYLDLIDRLVADGYFLSREHAIVRSIEEWFTRERVKEIQDHKQEVDKMTGKVVSVSTGEKDGVIPP